MYFLGVLILRLWIEKVKIGKAIGTSEPSQCVEFVPEDSQIGHRTRKQIIGLFFSGKTKLLVSSQSSAKKPPDFLDAPCEFVSGAFSVLRLPQIRRMRMLETGGVEWFLMAFVVFL